jgi:hypothetical protein
MAVKDVKGSVVNVAGQMSRARVDVVTAIVVAPIRMASVEVANQEKRKTTIATIGCNSGDRGSDLSHAVVTVLVVLWRDIDDTEEKGGVIRTWWANSAPEDWGGASVMRFGGVRIESRGCREESDSKGVVIVERTPAVPVWVWAVKGDPRIRGKRFASSSACFYEGKQAGKGGWEREASIDEKGGQLVKAMAECVDVEEEQANITGHCGDVGWRVWDFPPGKYWEEEGDAVEGDAAVFSVGEADWEAGCTGCGAEPGTGSPRMGRWEVSVPVLFIIVGAGDWLGDAVMEMEVVGGVAEDCWCEGAAPVCTMLTWDSRSDWCCNTAVSWRICAPCSITNAWSDLVSALTVLVSATIPTSFSTMDWRPASWALIAGSVL